MNGRAGERFRAGPYYRKGGGGATFLPLPLLGVFLLFLGGLAAGTFGALFGLGGGVLMVPLLVVALDVPMHNAVATSLIAVIATSSSATPRNVLERMANLRLVVTLEVLTVAGAIAGGFVAGTLPARALMILFAVTILALSVVMARGAEPPPPPAELPDVGFLSRLHGSYFDSALGREVRYGMRRLPLAMGVSGVAGVLSGLLGIGGGIVQVPILSLYCGIPMKVAAATSNAMIGVTAMASVFAYFGRGEILPVVTAASVLGIVSGSWTGRWLSARVHPIALRRWFALVMALIALQMVWKVFH